MTRRHGLDSLAGCSVPGARAHWSAFNSMVISTKLKSVEQPSSARPSSELRGDRKSKHASFPDNCPVRSSGKMGRAFCRKSALYFFPSRRSGDRGYLGASTRYCLAYAGLGRFEMEALLCSIPDAAAALGLGRSKVYELIGEGRLETISIGRRRLVRVASVKALASKPDA